MGTQSGAVSANLDAKMDRVNAKLAVQTTKYGAMCLSGLLDSQHKLFRLGGPARDFSGGVQNASVCPSIALRWKCSLLGQG